MLFRYLILDDDIRVEFGKAHDHARTIASTVLADLTGLLESKLYTTRYRIFVFT